MSTLNCLVLLLALYAAACEATCPESDQIRCKVNDRCTRIRYICDGDNDCGDNSDEDPILCQAWRNDDCGRNEAMCYRFGSSNCVTFSRYCELTDPPCEGDVDPRLCLMLSNGTLQDLNSIELNPEVAAIGLTAGVEGVDGLEVSEALGERFAAIVNSTLRGDGCPHLFTRVGGECVSIFFPGNVKWGEAKEFCHTIGGELLQMNRDYSFYATLVHHLLEHDMTADFWLGGRKSNSTSPWAWLEDDSPIDDSLPYWAVRHNPECETRPLQSLNTSTLNTTLLANQGHCYHNSRAPATPPQGRCLALTYSTYYHMEDVPCLYQKSPLCVAKGGEGVN